MTTKSRHKIDSHTTVCSHCDAVDTKARDVDWVPKTERYYERAWATVTDTIVVALEDQRI